MTVPSGTPTWSGYQFAGWNTHANGGGNAYDAGDTFQVGTLDVTLYAQWVQLYSITYDANSAKVTGDPPTDTTWYRPGDTMVMMGEGAMQLTGCSFSAWSTQPNGSGTTYHQGEMFSYPAPENLTLYATWICGVYVKDGPLWRDNPPTYSCVEACAITFGGAATEYACSTDAYTINHLAWVSGYGDPVHCAGGGAPVSETYKLGDTYSGSPAYSAFVLDACDRRSVNYCFPAAIPPE